MKTKFKGFVMTQREVAMMIGKSQQYVSMILSGRRRPSWALAKILSERFGRSPAWWMEADDASIRRVLRKKDVSRKSGGPDVQRRAA